MRCRTLVGLALAGLVLSGCGGADATSQSAAAPIEAPRPKPRNAADIAVAIVGGKIGALVYVDRVRNHPLAPQVAALESLRQVLEGSGIDPQRDIERAFVTAPSARQGDESVLVAQHAMDPQRVKTAVDALIARSDPPGGWIPNAPVPAARIAVRHHPCVIAVPEPNFFVVVPESHAQDAARFVGTGGFPDPEGPEAVVASAVDPAHSLRAPHVPAVPETIQVARAKVMLGGDGGADVDLEAASTSPAQAADDAVSLSRAFDRATSVSISVVKIRFFDPVRFEPAGDRVRAHVHLSAPELERLLSLAKAIDG